MQPARAAASAPDAAPATAAALFTPQQYEETIRRVPEGPQVVDVRGVAVHVAPNVMFNRIAAKPPWHMDTQRHERKEMITDMCVVPRCTHAACAGSPTRPPARPLVRMPARPPASYLPTAPSSTRHHARAAQHPRLFPTTAPRAAATRC